MLSTATRALIEVCGIPLGMLFASVGLTALASRRRLTRASA